MLHLDFLLSYNSLCPLSCRDSNSEFLLGISKETDTIHIKYMSLEIWAGEKNDLNFLFREILFILFFASYIWQSKIALLFGESFTLIIIKIQKTIKSLPSYWL